MGDEMALFERWGRRFPFTPVGGGEAEYEDFAVGLKQQSGTWDVEFYETVG